MTNSTPESSSPKAKSLQFIRVFARLYGKCTYNEDIARKMAEDLVFNSPANC